MTNKDNGFRVRVHNENRMNTYILKQAAAIRNDDFDEWCGKNNKNMHVHTMHNVDSVRIRAREILRAIKKKKKNGRLRTDQPFENVALAWFSLSVCLLKWNRESYDRTMVSIQTARTLHISKTQRTQHKMQLKDSACLKCRRRRLCVKPVSNTMNAWWLRCLATVRSIRCNAMQGNKHEKVICFYNER